jgi:hypothetical protein
MKKTNLDSLLREIQDGGWTPGLTDESYQNIIESGFRAKNLALAARLSGWRGSTQVRSSNVKRSVSGGLFTRGIWRRDGNQSHKSGT